MLQEISNGGKFLQRTKRGLSVFDCNEMVEKLNVVTNAPIFKDSMLKGKLQQIIDETIKAAEFEPI